MKIKTYLLLFLLSLIALPAFSQSFKKGPYLILGGNNTEMKVLWQNTGISTDQISWGTDLNYSMGTAANTSYGSDFQHLYTITGLNPGTKYYYKVVVNGVTKNGSFFTPPLADATTAKFLVYGDTRTNPNYHNAVAAKINSTCLADQGYQSVLLSVGDLVSSGYLEDPWNNEFFNYSYPDLMNMFASIPYESAVGNHEFSGTSTLFNKYFPYNFIGGRYYYSFDYGPVHFVVLDQYTSYTTGSSQYNWLVNDLATSNKPWKFICLHEPGWSAGGGHENNTTVQNVIEPLCIQYNVPIVFAGHNHYYARAAVPTGNGNYIQHVTAGAAGAPLYTPNLTYPYIVSGASAYHFCKISIEDNYTLKFETIKSDGTLLDQFTISRNIPVTGVSVAPTTLSLQIGATNQLTATVSPSNASNKAISWSSSNTSVATVSSTGLVAAVASGTAEITVTTADGNFAATCTVTVLSPPIITYYSPVSAILQQGTIKSGSYLNLSTNDAVYYVLNSKAPKPYITDWYAKFVISENPANLINLTVNYDGKYSRSLTQILYLYNFVTSSWVQFNSRNINTSDVTTTFTPSNPANYVSSTGEIRVRVYASNNSKSFTCSGDWFQIKVESIVPPIGFTSENSQITKNESSEITFSAFPNPSNDKITFSLNFPSDSQADINLYDINGVKVAQITTNTIFKAGSNFIDFNTFGLDSGVYFCKLRLNNSTEEKLLKISIKK